MTDFTPKEIGRRMKARGLKRLRWYCQRCEKQCGDENGFKSHCGSAGHIRQMALFRENAAAEMTEYTRRFVAEFTSALRRKGGQRVSANRVYQEHIADRHHTHLNSTVFDSLTSFVLFLGKEKLADIECDERGEWFIKAIDRDPRTLARAAEAERREERMRASEQAELHVGAPATSPPTTPPLLTSPVRNDPDEIKRLRADKIALSFAAQNSHRVDGNGDRYGDGDRLSAMIAPPNRLAASAVCVSRKRVSALDDLMRETERHKRANIAPDSAPASWLRAGIVVKIFRRDDADYKAKAVVVSVSGREAVVRAVVSGRIIRIADSEAETVIPSVGRDVLIVRGQLNGTRATLSALTADGLRARLVLRDDQHNGAVDADFDEFCKLAE